MTLAQAYLKTERDYFEELREHTFARAIADGMEIITPTDNQISLDIDRQWPHETAYLAKAPKEIKALIHRGDPKVISLVFRFWEEFKIERTEAWKSTGGNIHVLLTIKSSLDAAHRIAIQAMLGSDPMRELLNLRRVLCGAEDPIALFRPKTSVPAKEDNRS